jgi:hypothetical protein
LSKKLTTAAAIGVITGIIGRGGTVIAIIIGAITTVRITGVITGTGDNL